MRCGSDGFGSLNWTWIKFIGSSLAKLRKFYGFAKPRSFLTMLMSSLESNAVTDGSQSFIEFAFNWMESSKWLWPNQCCKTHSKNPNHWSHFESKQSLMKRETHERDDQFYSTRASPNTYDNVSSRNDSIPKLHSKRIRNANYQRNFPFKN